MRSYVYLHRYTQICYWANRVKPGYSFGARKDTLWSIWCFVFHIYIFTIFLSNLDAVAESSGWYSLMLRGWLARLISSIWERSKCSEIQDQDGSCFKVILHNVDKRLGGCNSYNTFREFLEVSRETAAFCLLCVVWHSCTLLQRHFCKIGKVQYDSHDNR